MSLLSPTQKTKEANAYREMFQDSVRKIQLLSFSAAVNMVDPMLIQQECKNTIEKINALMQSIRQNPENLSSLSSEIQLIKKDTKNLAKKAADTHKIKLSKHSQRILTLQSIPIEFSTSDEGKQCLKIGEVCLSHEKKILKDLEMSSRKIKQLFRSLKTISNLI
ncbi:MAG: hypothetical protein COT85_01215 [Chlamydiae bacterium CG10_big_fil_rev_8_21_14_0_10_42_34]|nr:MAG: hypothetical protein COT85_01215 [Chlamydiae bacterium CG10_big_fil_rev_8_21_14_0_10_42_34]